MKILDRLALHRKEKAEAAALDALALEKGRALIAQEQEANRRREAIRSLEALPMNYGIIEDLIRQVNATGLEAILHFADGTGLTLRVPDTYDAHKTAEDIARAYWTGELASPPIRQPGKVR